MYALIKIDRSSKIESVIDLSNDKIKLEICAKNLNRNDQIFYYYVKHK